MTRNDTTLDGRIYIDGENFALLKRYGIRWEHNLSFYFKDGILTCDLENISGVAPFSISSDVLAAILEEAQGNTPDMNGMPVIDESVMEEFEKKVSVLFAEIIENLPSTVTDESLTIGGAPLDCAVTTYTVDTESIKEIITTFYNGLNGILGEMGEGFTDAFGALIEALISQFEMSGNEGFGDFGYFSSLFNDILNVRFGNR